MGEENGVVKSLRPAYGDNKNATMELEKNKAEKLIRNKTLKIGWLRCAVKERITLTKCYKCQAFGHIIRGRTGPDRSNQCLRCGKTDRKAKECRKAKEFCQTWNSEGQRTDLMKCTAYKRMVGIERAKIYRRDGEENPSETATKDPSNELTKDANRI